MARSHNATVISDPQQATWSLRNPPSVPTGERGPQSGPASAGDPAPASPTPRRAAPTSGARESAANPGGGPHHGIGRRVRRRRPPERRPAPADPFAPPTSRRL